MTVDFSRLTNTDMNTTPFQYIIFGKGGGLLEVELNEAQLLAYNRQKNTLKLLGNCYRSDDNNTGMFSLSSDKKLVINKGIMVVDGNLFRFPEQVSLNIGLSSNTCTLYAHVSTETLGKDDTVNKFGVEKAGSIDNTILDNRFGIETTKRLSVSLSFDTNSSNGLCIGSFNNGVYSAPDNSNNTVLPVYSMGETKELLDILSSALSSHVNSEGNPHNVTKSQIGLGNVENKSSATIRDELTSGNVTKALGYTPLDSAKKGSANGVAELDSNGLVPSNQLPSYVDDVLEGTATGTSIDATTKAISATGFILTGQSTACTPEKGKIYLDTTTNIQFRWSGSVYISTGSFLALGETGSTAYRGDRGKVAYDHSQKTSGNPHGVTKSDVGLGNVPNVATNDQTVTYSDTSTLATLSSGEKISVVFAKIKLAITNLINHIANKNNPHSVTKSQIGLGSVDNTADLDKPISTSTQTALNDINSNLDDLAYGEFAGGKNLFTTRYYSKNYDGNTIVNGENSVTITSSYYSVFVMKLDANTNYTFSVDGDTPSVLGIYDSISNTKIQETKNNKTVTFNTGNYTNISIYVYSAIGTTATKTFTKMQLEKGSSATAYEPYIMSNKQLGALNESLEDYGLENLGNISTWKQGAVSDSSIDVLTNSKAVYIELNVKEGDVVTLQHDNASQINFQASANFSTFISGKYYLNTSDKVEYIVPSGANTLRVCIRKDTDITPTTKGKVYLYVNSAIEKLKNDLSEQKELYSDTTINVGRKSGTTVGTRSTAEGYNTIASGSYSHAEGNTTNAIGDSSHAEGKNTYANKNYSHAEGYGSKANEAYTHAEGYGTEAKGSTSHAEGDSTIAGGGCSHAEGSSTEAYASNSHAEGKGTTVNSSAWSSHAEGENTCCNSKYSHSEGYYTITDATYSHSEGNNTTTMVGVASHIEGNGTNSAGDLVGDTSVTAIRALWEESKFPLALGEASHVEGKDCLGLANYTHTEGLNCTSLGVSSHAEGDSTISGGQSSHAEGCGTYAGGAMSHAGGFGTTAGQNQYAIGHYNSEVTGTEIMGKSSGTAFVIGNGIVGSYSNALRITGEGTIYATNTTIQSGADYAEYFEWSDENPDSEDRVGYFVTLDEDSPNKIRIANNGDYILGIVSGMPSVIGNGDECWKQRYILDEFGRYIEEEFECEVSVGVDSETGEEIKKKITGTKWKENPDYDPTLPYIPRAERKEWSAVGMVGVLSVFDDGTCKVNGYCKVSDGGIATSAKPTEYIPFTNPLYRVIERVTDNIIKVVIL